VSFEHGGNLEKAARVYGRAPESFLDFSVNLNPLGCPPGLLDGLTQGLGRIGRYPDPRYTEALEELGAYLGVSPEALLITNGGAEAIDLVSRLYKPALGVTLEPTFVEYRRAVINSGGQPLAIDRRPVAGGSFSADLVNHHYRYLLKQGQGGEAVLVFICNPNNPSGEFLDYPFFEALDLPGSVLVIDEAFVDFVGADAARSAARLRALAAEGGNMVVVGSLTKSLAIPGLRLGYVVANPETIDGLRGLQVAWSVNALAQLVAETINDPELDEFLGRSREMVTDERRYLAGGLDALDWLTVYPSTVNYLLCKVNSGPRAARQLINFLGRQGILVRDCSNFAGLDARYIRIGVKTRDLNRRLLQGICNYAEVSSYEG